MPNKDLRYYEALPYRVALSFDPDDHVWIIQYPELPGCVAHGATKEEALARGEEVRSLWLETALKHHDAIPEPQSEPPYSGKLVLRLPKTLHARASQAARQEGVSLNTYLVQLIAEGAVRSGLEGILRFVGGALQKAFRRLTSSANPSAYRVRLEVEPVFGQDKEPLHEHVLQSLPSESPESGRDGYAK